MAMESVSAYKTSDGKLWGDPRDATAHEKSLTRRKEIEDWVDRHCFSQMHTSDIVDELVEHGHEIGV